MKKLHQKFFDKNSLPIKFLSSIGRPPKTTVNYCCCSYLISHTHTLSCTRYKISARTFFHFFCRKKTECKVAQCRSTLLLLLLLLLACDRQEFKGCVSKALALPDYGPAIIGRQQQCDHKSITAPQSPKNSPSSVLPLSPSLCRVIRAMGNQQASAVSDCSSVTQCWPPPPCYPMASPSSSFSSSPVLQSLPRQSSNANHFLPSFSLILTQFVKSSSATD